MEKRFPEKYRKILIAVAAILVVAVAFEFLFVALSNRNSDYPKSSIGAESFDSWEIEDKGEGNYYMLAYNSYFFVDDLGGLRIDNIEVSLTRSNSDPTETVVYFVGKVNGIYGEFMAPLVKTGDGVYTSRLGADSVDRIEIFPTETVRSTLSFGGIVINPSVTAEAFSASRVLLWGMLGGTLFAIYLLIRAYSFKKGEKPPMWRTVYFVLCGIVLLVLFEGSRMFTAASGLESVLIPLGFAAFTAVYAAVWFICVKLRRPHEKVAAVALVAGILFTFSTAPLQVPDETNHYLRAYAISCGQFDFDYNYDYPGDVRLLADTFTGQFYYNVQEPGLGSTIDGIKTFLSTDASGYIGRDDCHCTIQIIFPYIPAAIGIAAVRVFGANALVCLYAGRLMNVFVFAVAAFFAVKLAKRYRGALIATILLPLTVFIAAGVSYDSLFVSACILMFGYIFKEDFRRRDLVAVILLFSLIVFIKPVYVPLALLILTIPKKEYHVKINRGLTVLLVICFGALAYIGSLIYADIFARSIPSTTYLEGVDKLAQIKYVLSNPVRYALVMVVDGYLKSFYLNTFGLLGSLDVSCVLTNLLSPIVLVSVAVLYADTARRYKKSDTVIFSAVTLVGYAVIVTGFYAMWSTLGSTSILGVQLRYFIPFLPACVALVSKAFSGAVGFARDERARDNICIALCSCLSVLSAVELFTKYFLM